MKITHLPAITLLAVSLATTAWGQSSFRFGLAYQMGEQPAAAPVAVPPAPAAEPPAPVAEMPAPVAVPPAPAAEMSAPVAEPPAPAAEPPAPVAEPPAPAAENAIASPSDVPAPTVQPSPQIRMDELSEKPVVDKEIQGGCGDGCSAVDGSCGSGLSNWFPCCPREGWKLPQPCFLQQHKTVLGGWLQQGITFNANDPADGFNGPVATNDLDSEYQMNQMWLYLHRPADNGGCGFAWGGHIDIMYGTDGRFGINKGLEDRIYGFNNETYGIVIPQFYLELAYNNLSVKLGHFAGILDYEMVPGPFNPFYSHSYSYGYTVPQLVTGALADYKLNDNWSVQAGTHRGWMQFEDFNDAWDVMAGIKWQSCDQKTELRYALSSGKQSMLPLGLDDKNRFVSSIVFQHQVSEPLKYVAVQNLGIERDPLRTGADAQWYGLNQYLLYTINKCWSANLRAEWMRDDDGMRIGGPGNMDGVRAWDGFGYAGNFYNITAGLNWRPTTSWLIRPEVRWDWYEGEESWIPGKPALPFDGGNGDSQTTFAVDAILMF